MRKPFLPARLLPLFGLAATCSAGAVQAQTAGRPLPAVWREEAAARAAAAPSLLGQRLTAYRALTLDAPALRAALAAAPVEGTANARSRAVTLTLPLPDGTTGSFRVVEAPIMEAGLAAQYPTIKTYAGIGLDDPTATLRADVTPLGFHAQILSRRTSAVYIDPVSLTDQAHYIAYDKRHLDPARRVAQGACGYVPEGPNPLSGTGLTANTPLPTPGGAAQRAAATSGATLRTYRLCVAATGEYTAFFGGTVPLAQAAIVTSVNRVTGVYEKEVAIRMILIANNSSVVYTNGGTDPYTNNNGSTMLGQNQTNLTSVIGAANYDIGHVFSTGGGGVASLGSVCVATRKAQGVTGSGSPVNDAFDIDYVAHEVGHQFGGNHTFNSVTSSCGGGNRNASTAYEPGSGITIMAYAGICGADNIASNSIPFFHGVSQNEITAFSTTGAGNGCAVQAASGNTPPTVSAPANRSIPRSTPFTLTATGSDADGDALTYIWEEFDQTATGGAVVTTATTQTANVAVPLFRNFAPAASPTRYFPRLTDLVNNTFVFGEALPTVARTMNFRCTARDQHMSNLGMVVGGVNATPSVTLTVVGTAGPFAVTAPNTAVTYAGNSTQTVTWSVNSTDVAPISCATVNIRLSTDGGLTYPTTILAGTANDGTQAVTIPNTATTQARIMVEAVGNYFFDISNANFTITASAVNAPTITSFNPTSGPVGTSVTITGTNLTGATNVSFNGTTATIGTNSATQITTTVPAGATTGTISVTTGNGTATSAGTFTVVPTPTITSFNPTSGPTGTSVTVTGTNFTGASNVAFNGTTASFTVASATSITTSVPAGAITGTITVTTPGGTATSATSFTVVPVPTITSFTPTTGAVGMGVTITGTNFTGATLVRFNTTSATFLVASATSITTTVPAGATTGTIRVTTPGGVATSATNFTVVAAPAITTLNPINGVVGSSVQINGTGLGSATSVTFTGGATATITANTTTRVTVTVPAGAQTGPITVVTAGGTATSPTFTVNAAISSFTPAIGPVGTSVAITGTGFNSVSGVTFSNIAAASFVVNSSTSITAVVPATAATGRVRVITAANTAVSATNFTVMRITGLNPTSGTVGASVQINGTGLTGATSVTFTGGATATITANTATRVTVTVPTAAQTGPITVVTPNGTLTSGSFTVNAAITSFTPLTGPVGTGVTITGSGFVGATSVTFNNITATVSNVVSANSITATVPAGATTGRVRVITPGNTAVSAVNFTVIGGPAITSFNPITGAVGAAVTITGTNLTGATALRFNGTLATIGTNTATTITTTVPTGATTGVISVTTAGGTATSSSNFTVTGAANTPPTITAIANQRACTDQPLTVSFTVGDTQTPVANLVVTASSPGQGTIISSLTPGGADASRTLDIAPLAAGTTSVTVTVTDAANATAQRTFSVQFDGVISVAADPSATRTEAANQDVVLNGSSTGSATLLWTTSGSGSFSAATSATGNYTPSAADYLAGSVTLTLTATPSGGSTCGGASSDVVINFTRPNLTITATRALSGAYQDVTISAGTTTVDGPLDIAGTLTVQAGATLLTDAATCQPITGNGAFVLAAGATLRICSLQGITQSGPTGQVQTATRSFAADATYIYDGLGANGAQATGNGLPATVRALTVENTAGADLTQALNMRQTLTLNGGDLRTNSQPLTLLSDATGTALVVNTAGAVVGIAIAQRYVNSPTNAGVGYHHLSAPVTGTTFADLATTGFVPLVNAAYNVKPDGIPATSFPNIFGFDESRAPASADFTLGYFSPNALTDGMESGRGYSVSMQGQLTYDLSGTLTTGLVTRTGLTRTGNFAGNTEKSGWYLGGNPYPSPIDWDLMTIPAGLSSAVSVWRTTGLNAGVYTVYTNNVGGGGTDLIAQGQAFFVRVLTPPVDLAFTNACRVTSYTDPGIGRPTPEVRPLLNLTLRAAGANVADEAAVYFEEGATVAATDARFDGAKPRHNVGVPTLLTGIGADELAINGLPLESLITGIRLPLTVDLPTAGTYELNVGKMLNLSTTPVTLVDALTGTRLPLTATATYAFTAPEAGLQTGRFSLIFGRPAPAVAGAPRLNVYPNPAAARATVRVAGVTGTRLTLFDALGRPVRTQPVTGDEALVSLTGLPAGVYTVRCGEATSRLVVE